MNRHELDFNKIRGFGRGKPLFLFVFLMAGLGISGIPLWSGYISKTLLHKGIIEVIQLYQGLQLEFLLHLTDVAFILTSGLTFGYMLKLFVVLFVESDERAKEKGPYISVPSALALAVSAALVPVLGSFTVIMERVAYWGQAFFHGQAPDYPVYYFSWVNLKGSVITVAIGLAVYFIFVRGLIIRRTKTGAKIYVKLWPELLDLEILIYRPALGFIVRSAGLIAYAASSVPDALANLCRSLHRRLLDLWKAPAMIGDFSLDLLLVGIGVCATLVFMFIQALGF
jgi:hydrogenase-4 component B